LNGTLSSVIIILRERKKKGSLLKSDFSRLPGGRVGAFLFIIVHHLRKRKRTRGERYKKVKRTGSPPFSGLSKLMSSMFSSSSLRVYVVMHHTATYYSLFLRRKKKRAHTKKHKEQNFFLLVWGKKVSLTLHRTHTLCARAIHVETVEVLEPRAHW
jgi:hypothetical protein